MGGEGRPAARGRRPIPHEAPTTASDVRQGVTEHYRMR